MQYHHSPSSPCSPTFPTTKKHHRSNSWNFHHNNNNNTSQGDNDFLQSLASNVGQDYNRLYNWALSTLPSRNGKDTPKGNNSQSHTSPTGVTWAQKAQQKAMSMMNQDQDNDDSHRDFDAKYPTSDREETTPKAPTLNEGPYTSFQRPIPICKPPSRGSNRIPVPKETKEPRVLEQCRDITKAKVRCHNTAHRDSSQGMCWTHDATLKQATADRKAREGRTQCVATTKAKTCCSRLATPTSDLGMCTQHHRLACYHGVAPQGYSSSYVAPTFSRVGDLDQEDHASLPLVQDAPPVVSKQCVATSASTGARCRRMTKTGDYCSSHSKHNKDE